MNCGVQSRAVTETPLVNVVINPKAVYNHTITRDNIQYICFVTRKWWNAVKRGAVHLEVIIVL
jgi:hypothetical protein